MRQTADLVRLCIVCLVTYLLYELTNPSQLYHSIRGQSDFKLYSLKIICEIVHTMMIHLGSSAHYNFSRELQLYNCAKSQRTLLQKRLAILRTCILLFLYTLMHSFVLTVEMLITHVVLTLPSSSQF